MSEQNTTPTVEETKTFTQEDVNRIVQERLAKERTKGDATLVQREQDLAQRELLLTAKEKLTTKGLPLELLDALNISSPEALDKSLAAIEKLQISLAPAGALPAPALTTSTPAKISSGAEHNTDGGDAEGESIRAAMGLKIK